MDQGLAHDLYNELIHIQEDMNQKWPLVGNRFPTTHVTKREFVDEAIPVIHLLKQHPYLSARDISDKTGLSKYHLAVIYKMIQRSDMCQDIFKRASSRDYVNVVNHYFNHSLFTLVFFVGNACPSRCLYCPNVTVDSLGRRRLTTYPKDTAHALSDETLDTVFFDLKTIRQNGKDLLVKISGGLEPLTDMPTFKAIVNRCNTHSIPVKLFTNGLLLTDSHSRAAALSCHDVRISLNTPDPEQFENICFSSLKPSKAKYTLANLKQNIQDMISERPRINPMCRIGLNCVVLPDNHKTLVALMEMARELEIDYVDIKPNYTACYDKVTQKAMDESVREAKVVASHESYRDLFVNFTASLSPDDLYWNAWPESFDAVKQSDFKMFITPQGQCSPVHYGAFPHDAASFKKSLTGYTMGHVDPEHGLIDVLSHPKQHPEINLEKLNPFELMMALEIKREEKDKKWGLPMCVSPYHTRNRDKVPADLFFRFDIKGS